jgi:hypothetical protein
MNNYQLGTENDPIWISDNDLSNDPILISDDESDSGSDSDFSSDSGTSADESDSDDPIGLQIYNRKRNRLKNQIVTARRSSDSRQVKRAREAYGEDRECLICFESFNQNILNRRRVILNCGHNLCRQCRLSNIYIPSVGEDIGNVQTRCPTCQGYITEEYLFVKDRTSEVLEEQMKRLNTRVGEKRKRKENDYERKQRKRLKIM